MATVFDPNINYEMMLSQGNIGILKTRFLKPKKADAILEKNPADFNELINLVLQGTNTNNYLNTRLDNLSKIAKKLDSAIVKEYGNNFF
jgi:hypothetical protein